MKVCIVMYRLVVFFIILVGCCLMPPISHAARGVRDDVESYRQAAEKGDAVAQSRLGHLYLEGKGVEKDYKQAAHWLGKAAEQGEGKACNSLGVIHLSGLGVKRDPAQARQWFLAGIARNDPGAHANMGMLYYLGHGVGQDFATAERLFRQAANRGDVGGQFNLGLMHALGQGVPKDLVQGYLWLTLAVAAGDEQATRSRAQLAKDMTPDQIAQGEALARQWRPE